MSTRFDDMLDFHLTGRHGDEIDAAPASRYRPALLAPYGRLTALRYDFPLILLGGPDSPAFVDSLSAVIDRLLREIAPGGDAGTLLRQHVLRLEMRMRAVAASRHGIPLTELWDEATRSLLAECGKRETEVLGNSLSTARFALRVDGPVLDCNDELPARLLRHAWEKVEARRTHVTLERIESLLFRLREMLKVDELKGRESRSPARLRQTFGRRYREAFDFELMAEVLEGSRPHNPLPEARRERIENSVSVLENQRFFAPFESARKEGNHDFVFDSLSDALRAWKERLQEIADVIRAIAVAELEADNAFREDRHPAYFRRFGVDALSPEDLAMFPSYLVCLRERDLSIRDTARLTEIVTEELPMKVLLQVSDVLHGTSSDGDHPQQGSTVQQLAHTFLIGDAYVLQSAASNLYRQSEHLLRGLEFDGPAVFCLFVPEDDAANALPPYLAAAAATESRAFPAFAYDPATKAGLAGRFDISGNPEADADWPCRELRYEDEALQTVKEAYCFTMSDFAVAEPMLAEHFEPVEKQDWSDAMLPMAEYLELADSRTVDKVPYVAVVDSDDRLYRLVVDDYLVRLTRHCRDRWHTLQELGGVHNSWAEAAREAAQAEAAATQPVAEPLAENEDATPAETEPTVQLGADDDAGTTAEASDEPWVETPRCTTCDECTTRNSQMFAYDDNKQAYIRDPDAGTFRDLVEAAETCQVAIIHPGTPRNPDEPGLAELIERAAPFNSR